METRTCLERVISSVFYFVRITRGRGCVFQMMCTGVKNQERESPTEKERVSMESYITAHLNHVLELALQLVIVINQFSEVPETRNGLWRMRSCSYRVQSDPYSR